MSFPQGRIPSADGLVHGSAQAATSANEALTGQRRPDSSAFGNQAAASNDGGERRSAFGALCHGLLWLVWQLEPAALWPRPRLVPARFTYSTNDPRAIAVAGGPVTSGDADATRTE